MNPKPKLPLKDSLQQPLPPKEEAEEENHHSSNDVDTNTAFKFLLAGGIAGAGSYQPTGSCQPLLTCAPISIQNSNRSF
jgi:hypothetical protein